MNHNLKKAPSEAPTMEDPPAAAMTADKKDPPPVVSNSNDNNSGDTAATAPPVSNVARMASHEEENESDMDPPPPDNPPFPCPAELIHLADVFYPVLMLLWPELYGQDQPPETSLAQAPVWFLQVLHDTETLDLDHLTLCVPDPDAQYQDEEEQEEELEMCQHFWDTLAGCWEITGGTIPGDVRRSCFQAICKFFVLFGREEFVELLENTLICKMTVSDIHLAIFERVNTHLSERNKEDNPNPEDENGVLQEDSKPAAQPKEQEEEEDSKPAAQPKEEEEEDSKPAAKPKEVEDLKPAAKPKEEDTKPAAQPREDENEDTKPAAQPKEEEEDSKPQTQDEGSPPRKKLRQYSPTSVAELTKTANPSTHKDSIIHAAMAASSSASRTEVAADKHED